MTVAADRMAQRLSDPFACGADRDASQAIINPYGFTEHTARFGAAPDPRYVVTALADVISPTVLTVGYERLPPTGPPVAGRATLLVPAGTLAGMSALLVLGSDEGAAVRLRNLSVTPAPLGGATADRQWAVTALLGNLAKLLWIVGWERDALRAYLAQVRSQITLDQAVGQTLDLLGFDLGVPRFPPLPYTFEEGTVALYHLDEPTTATHAADAQVIYGGAGHPSSNLTAAPGATGRFGAGYAFRSPQAQVLIGDHPDFAFGASDSFTVECFARPDTGDWSGAVLSKDDPANPATPGWSLAAGEFGRGLPRNLRVVLNDGTRILSLYADVSLETARFQHLALVVDRPLGQARIHIDGKIHASGALSGFGALVNSEPLRIGGAAQGQASAFLGVVDEVRISRAARTAFHPVLGESDGRYRQRLRIFRRWALPTPATLQAALNDAVGDVAGEPKPFIVTDTDATVVRGQQALTIYPSALRPGESIDAQGSRHTPADQASGEADDPFDPLFLVRFGAPPDTRLMQVGTRRALTALLERLSGLGEPSGLLRVEDAFDPAAGGLLAVGRALSVSYQGSPTLSLGAVAALAHLAGFSWVQVQPDGQHFYASVPAGDLVEILGGNTGPDGFDLLDGGTIKLSVDPQLPVGTIYRWSTIPCGPGRADIQPAADGSSAQLRATAPGAVFVRLEVQRREKSYTATRRLRIGIQDLPSGHSIAADGSREPDPAVAGQPGDGFFDPAYLITFDDPSGAIEADTVNDRRMQPAVADLLRTLLERISADGGGGVLRLASGWVPGGAGLDGVGRALTLDPAPLSLSADRLAGLAHAAGFSYVRNEAGLVQLLHEAGDMVTITGPGEVTENEPAQFTVSPRALASAAAAPAGPSAAPAHGHLYVASAGTDMISEIDIASGSVRRAAKTGAAPASVAVTPDGSRLFTADTDGATITTIDLASGQVTGVVSLGGNPQTILHHPALPRLYACVPDLGSLVELDSTSTLQITRSVMLGSPPVDAALSADGSRAWVALSQSRRVVIVDTGTMATAGTVQLPNAPTRVALGAARAYVTMSVARQLAVIDLAGLALQSIVSGVGTSPGAIAVSGDGQTIFVADSAERGLYVRNADGTAETGTGVNGFVPLSGAPVYLVVTANRLYAIQQDTGDGFSTDAVGVLSTDGPAQVLAAWPLGTGHGERMSWALQLAGPASASLSSSTKPEIDLRPATAGTVLLSATYLWPDDSPPRTFRVGFSQAIHDQEAAGAKVLLRKDDYDLVMNVLNVLHPAGVEVNTSELRAHVAELSGVLDLFPAYTYPDFRARRSPPAVCPTGATGAPGGH